MREQARDAAKTVAKAWWKCKQAVARAGKSWKSWEAYGVPRWVLLHNMNIDVLIQQNQVAGSVVFCETSLLFGAVFFS
jgi:hypothetical protein